MTTTPSGFLPLRFEDHRQNTLALWREAYGDDSNTASDTPDGLAIDFLSIIRTRYGQRLGTVYGNAFFGTAEGLHLDAVLSAFDSPRKEPGGSTVEVIMFGALGTQVLKGSIANTIAGDSFVSDAQETIAETVFIVLTYGPADVTATLASAQIAGVTYSADVPITGTGLQVAQSLAAGSAGLPAGPEPIHGSDGQIAKWYSPYEDAQGNGVIVLELIASAPFAAFATESDAAQWYGDPATMTSELEAAIPAELLTLTRIGSSTPGWEGVANLRSATLGSGEQSDPEYRVQHVLSLGKQGSATPRSLAASLRDQRLVPGSEFVRIYMNVSGALDPISGRPSHSFEAVVSGGSDEDIAITIWKQHTTGTQSFGSTSVTINDPKNGEVRIVRFTRPTERFVWASIEVKRGEAFPTTPILDIQRDVQDAIFAWGITKSVGFDIYLDEAKQQLSIPGTAAITIRFGTTAQASDPPPPLSILDLLIDETQLTRWLRDRIAVTVVD